MVDTFVNKPGFAFILLFCLRVEFFTRVNPPLGSFTLVLNFVFSKITTYTTYTHTQNICLQFEFDFLFTTSGKILGKIFGSDFTLEKPTVYDHGKNI